MAPKVDPNLKEEKFMRTTVDYQTMGYPVNEAELMIEQDLAAKEGMEAITKQDPKKQVNSTKEEQEKLLTKMQAFAKKEDVTASNIDFSKPID